jgi:hypothetical protein
MEWDVANNKWVPAGTAGAVPVAEAPATEVPAGGEAEKASE